MTTLLTLLNRGLEKADGSQQALADALGISRPRVNSLLKKRNQYQLGIQPCFKLAAFLREEPATVLRLAGKGWLADLLVSHSGGAEVERLSREERSVLQDFDVVNARFPKVGERLREHLGELATVARAVSPKARRKSK